MSSLLAMLALFASAAAPVQPAEDLAAAQEQQDQEEIVLLEDEEIKDLQEITFEDECDSYANLEDLIVEN